MTTKQKQVPFLPLTIFQEAILKEYLIDRGLGEGYQRVYQRLKDDFGTKRHYALDSDGRIALTQAGDIYEETNPTPTPASPHSFNYNNKTYTYPTRLVTRKGVRSVQRRQLLPSKRAIMDWYRKQPQLQIDRQARHKPGGGKREAPKNTLAPHIPTTEVCGTIFMDSFRLPNTKVGKEIYSWAFICVDSLTRMVYIAPTHLQTALSLSTKQSAEQEVEGEYEPGKRPSSEQTFRHFKEFMKRIDFTRKEYAKRSGTVYPGNVKPRVIQCDYGSEFKGSFQTGLAKLRDENSKIVKGTRQYPYFNLSRKVGRSNANAHAELMVRHSRKYFFSLNRAYQEHVEEYKKINKKNPPKHWNPPDWHTTTLQSSDLYNWLLDVNEVLRRINSRYETTIRCCPIEALLQLNGNTYQVVLDRIKLAAKKRMAGARFDLNLPGFSPHKELEVGDFVRSRIHKIGSMNINFPRQNATNKQSTKGATNNFSQDIYKIVKIKMLSSGAPMYRVDNIDPYSKRAVKGFVDRTAILLISPETKIDGRKLPEHEEFLGKEPESDDEDDDVPVKKAPTRSAYEKELGKMLKQSAKDWTRLLRGRTFHLNGERNTIMEIEFRINSKYEVSGWVASYHNEEGPFDSHFKDVLQWSRGEPWYKPIYDDFLKKKFK